jgi:hypothetical protein
MFTVGALRVNRAARIAVQRIASISLMSRQQSKQHELVVRVTYAARIGARGPVHIRTSHNPEHEHEYSGPSFVPTVVALNMQCV